MNNMLIDLPAIYKCQCCKAILDIHRIETIKLDKNSINYCPVCNYNKLEEIKLGEMK